MFELTEAKAKLSQYVPRRELHGEAPVPAATLKLHSTLQADALAMFHPTLRSFLFCKAPTGDLADQAAEANDLRFPEIADPIKWQMEIIGAELTIDYGTGGPSNIVLPECNVTGFSIYPQQGGIVQVNFAVACHPDEAQSGKLAFMIGTDLTITLTPPGEKEGDE